MADTFSRDELRSLLETETVGCVSPSLYMPTFRAGRADVQQNPVHLKKLIVKARQRLEDAGLRRPEADAYLQPVQPQRNRHHRESAPHPGGSASLRGR